MKLLAHVLLIILGSEIIKEEHPYGLVVVLLALTAGIVNIKRILLFVALVLLLISTLTDYSSALALTIPFLV